MVGAHTTHHLVKIERPNTHTEALPVVTEKPFVTTSAEADRLIALANEKGKILTVFHSQYLPRQPELSMGYCPRHAHPSFQTDDLTAISALCDTS